MIELNLTNEMGNSELLAPTQKLFTEKITDIVGFHIEFSDNINRNGYYNTFTDADAFIGRNIITGSTLIFRCENMDEETTIAVEMRERDTYATYIKTIGILSKQHPFISYDNWDSDNYMFGYNVKNIGDLPLILKTESILKGQVTNIQAEIDCNFKLIKAMAAKGKNIVFTDTLNNLLENTIYILQSDITMPDNSTITIPSRTEIVFNGHTVMAENFIYLNSPIPYGNTNSDEYPILNWESGGTVKAGTRTVLRGMFKSSDNKVCINRMSNEHAYDLTVLNSFINTSFYIDEDINAYLGCMPIETQGAATNGLTDNCKFYAVNGAKLLGGEILVNGCAEIHNATFENKSSILLIDAKDKDSEQLSLHVSNCIFNSNEDHTPGLYAINDFYDYSTNSYKCPKNLVIENCKFTGYYSAIFVFCLANSIIRNNKFENIRGSNIRCACGWDNNIYSNHINGGVTGIISIPSETRSIEFMEKYGLIGFVNNNIYSNRIENISEEAISLDSMYADNDNYNAYISSNRNTFIIDSIGMGKTSAVGHFEYNDNASNNNCILYYKNAIICSISLNKGGKWGIIEKVDIYDEEKYSLQVKYTGYFDSFDIGDKFSINIGFIGNHVHDIISINNGATIALYNNCYGNCINNILCIGSGQFISSAYIDGRSDIYRTHMTPCCDNSFDNINSLNVLNIVLQDLSPQHGMNNIGLEESACFNNKITNCNGESLKIYNIKNINFIFGGEFNKIILENSKNISIKLSGFKQYVDDSCNKNESCLPYSNLLDGSVFYNNNRLKYKNANGIVEL